MLKQVGPSAKPLKTAEEVDNFLKIDDLSVRVVGYFVKQSEELYKNFLKTADALREEYKFGVITDKR
jgi:hypothetical protein